MTEIRNIEVSNLAKSIVKSGLPMRVGDDLIENMDYHIQCVEDFIDKKVQYAEDGIVGSEHIKRAIKLGNTPNGSGHGNYLKGIKVSFDLKYPEYLSPQLQRYNWFGIVSSQSKMHRLTKMDIKENCNKYVDEVVINNLNYWIDIYNHFDSECIVISGEKLYAENPEQSNMRYYTKYEIFMKIISNCPLGLEKWMAIETNYMQLKTIYLQRKSHKLTEDYKVICNMIENLPMFKELCLGEK